MTVDTLVLKFVTNHPSDAARRMLEFDSAEVAALIEALPAPVACTLCSRLTTRRLNEVLALLNRKHLATMLIEGPRADLIVLVSHMPDSLKEEVQQAAEPRDQSNLKRLLSTSLRTLSAIASPAFTRVTTDESCGQVCDELAAGDSDDERPIFAVHADGSFAGVVNLNAVIRSSNRSVPVGEIVEFVEPLSGQMPTSAAIAAAGWSRYRVMPIVDSSAHLLGALTYQQLLQAHHERSSENLSLEAMLGQVAGSYIDVCTDLLEMAVGGDVHGTR